MPPAPNNNQAATTDYNTAYAEFGNVYDPQVQQVQQQQAQVTQQAQVAQNQLDQAKANAFSNNALTANARGINFSGYTPMQNTSYTTNTYNPNVQKLQTNTANQQQTLQQKITDLNQQRANDANSLVQNTQQAQAQAAAAAASAARASRGSSGGSGGSSSNLSAVASQIDNYFKSNKLMGKDGYLSPYDYNDALSAWVQDGYGKSQFESIFGKYKNPKTKGYQ